MTEQGRSRTGKAYLDYETGELPGLQEHLMQQSTGSRTLTQTALHYPLGHPAVAAIIPGASSLMQLKLNIAAATASPLSPQELEAVRSASKPNRYTVHL